jgi:hypothetical protein
MTEEKDENLTVKDVVVLSMVATAVIIGVGGTAKIGQELAIEAIHKFKEKRNQKKQ